MPRRAALNGLDEWLSDYGIGCLEFSCEMHGTHIIAPSPAAARPSLAAYIAIGRDGRLPLCRMREPLGTGGLQCQTPTTARC
jgi:hypothetical protein